MAKTKIVPRAAASSRPAATSAPASAPAPAGSAADDKRERILTTAEELFFRHGYPGTTLDMICAELGATKPFVYYYFKDKQAIFETLCRRASVACLTALRDEHGNLGNLCDSGASRPAHRRLAEGLRRFVAANVANFRSGTFAYRDKASLRPEFQDELRTLANGFYDDLCALLEQGRAEGKLSFEDTKLTAMAMGSVAGFLYTWYHPDGRLGPEQMTDQLTAILFKMVGLRVRAPSFPAAPSGA